MANPFSGILSSALKTTFDNGIKALLESGAGSVPCRINYGVTKFTLCANCLYDPVGKKSASRYLSGGSVPFANGQLCPVCNGAGRISQESTESIDLIVIWDYKSWIDLGVDINSPEGFVQTLSEMSTLPKLKKAKDITMYTNLENYVRHSFVRHGEPVPVGLGQDSFIVTMWAKTS